MGIVDRIFRALRPHLAAQDRSNSKPPSCNAEVERAALRRKELRIRRGDFSSQRPWALALSGGGIRSATFCLGVLQGLSRTPSPALLDERSNGEDNTKKEVQGTNNLLAQFDFLSTVSGGGYIGSFFSSLFVRGRLSGEPDEDEITAADRAYRVLQEDPPERMRRSTVFDVTRPGLASLAWLRDNGRYLTPTGGGDVVDAAAIAIRNWFAVHFVAATVFLVVLSGSLFLRSIAFLVPGPTWLQPPAPLFNGALIFSSTWYGVALAIGIGLPGGIGYWFAHAQANKDLECTPERFTTSAVTALGFGLFCLLIGPFLYDLPATRTWGIVALTMGSLATAGSFAPLAAKLLGSKTVAAQRVALSRWLSTSLVLAGTLAALALVETLSLSALKLIDLKGLLTAGFLSGVATWLIRHISQYLQPDTSPKKRAVALSLEALATVLAAVLWVSIATILGLFLLWANFGKTDPFGASFGIEELRVTTASFIFMVFVAIVVGWHPGFVNLSTLQPFYSARLTRTYLGASNNARFVEGASELAHSVAEPIKGDSVTLEQLYQNPCAPIHFVNACLNQTAGPDGQLVQRDRKGKPLVTAPDGFYLDGEAHRLPASGSSDDLRARLTVGDWIGVSGAAVGTGLGRSTSLGISLLLGFANLRLGRWWPHGIDEDRTIKRAGLMRRLFTSQTYLFDEMTAKFHGKRLPLAYLSDGGHFENTGAYEMLRRDRKVELIVVCDCGADPNYEFGDLANLVRLARIDHQLEIKVNTAVVSDPKLNGVFGTPESFRRAKDGSLPKPNERCAVLLDVFEWTAPAPSPGRMAKLAARIIVLKPVLLDSMPSDISNHSTKYNSFPQDPTSDQFFDEAQWESYRKLGLEMVGRLFPQDESGTYASAFWKAVAVE